MFDFVVETLKPLKCVPTTSGSLAYPGDLIDTREMYKHVCISELYTDLDGRFADEEFNDFADALVTLGMIRNHLPIDQLVERASTVKTLEFSNGMKRMEKILEYICYTEHEEEYSISKRKERIEALSGIKFLRASQKPAHISNIPWYDKLNHKQFFPPNQLYSRDVSKLVFTQCPIFQSPFQDDNGKYDLIEKYIGIHGNIQPEIVVHNILCLIQFIESSKITDSATEAFINEVFTESYKFLNDCCTVEDHASMIQSKLSTCRCIWQNGQLSYPHQVIVDWKGKSCYPFLTCLSMENYKLYAKLFEILNVMKEPDFAFLIKTLSRVRKSVKNQSLNNDMLEFVVNIAEHTLNMKTPDTKISVYLPDSKRILHLASELFYKRESKAIPKGLEEKHFLHESISLEVANLLEVQSIQDLILEKNEDKRFIINSNNLQAEKYSDFLKNFLANSQSDTIFKEFIKLADSAEVSEIVFALDHRTDNPDEALLVDSEDWIKLQHSPALCIIFNKPLLAKDLSNLCGLEKSFNCMGNFNAVYHITDCPSITVFDENRCPTEFCVFDPLRQYCCKVDGPPGRRWFGTGSLSEFSDQFHPFLIDKIDQLSSNSTGRGFTVFRLPILTSNKLKKAKLKSVNAVQQSFEAFIDSSETLLLFLKEITSLSIFEIKDPLHGDESTEKIVCRFSTSLEKSKISGSRITDIGSTYTVQHQVMSCYDDENPEVSSSEWLLTECSQIPVGSHEQKTMIAEAKSEGLRPCGGVAINLKNAVTKDSRLYCVLPTEINSQVPVNMNAHFLINVPELRHLQKWNNFILKHVLVPLYIEAVLQAREFMKHDLSEEERASWYYSMFPKPLQGKQVSIFSMNTSEIFYDALLKLNSPILLAAQPDSCGIEKIDWLNVRQGYFLPLKRSRSVDEALVLLKMPLTCAPMYIYENLKNQNYATSKGCGLVDANRLCAYLGSLKISVEESNVLMKYCIPLLEFILENHVHNDDIDLPILFENVPILPTLRNTLSKAGQLFESKFASLLPGLEENFISPELENLDFTQLLIKNNVIVSLPIQYVAENIKLLDKVKPQHLNSEQVDLVLHIWKFLDNAIHMGANKELIFKYFEKKPILPTNKGYYPLVMSNQVFMPSSQHSYSDLIRKLGYPVLDISKVNKFAEMRTYIGSSVANSSEPDHVIKCMELMPPSQTEENQLTDSEVMTLLTIINTCNVVPLNVVNSLRKFPLFQTIGKTTRHSIAESKTVYVVPNDIPVKGLVKIQEATCVLLFHESKLDTYKRLLPDIQCPKPIRFYKEIILPNLKCFTNEKELRSHLSMVKNWICDFDEIHVHVNETEIRELQLLLREHWLIPLDGEDDMCHVYELYYPRIDFHCVFHKNRLIPQKWIISGNHYWLDFLKKLGLHTEVTHEDWLCAANKVAEEGSQMRRVTVNQLTKQSDTLLKTLNQMFIRSISNNYEENDDAAETACSINPDLVSFLKSAAKIPFINNNKDALSLREMINGFSSKPLPSHLNTPLFIPFNGSFLNSKDTSIILLCQNVLPSSCDFLHDCHEEVRAALSVKTQWNDVLVENLIALSDCLCDTDVQQFVFSKENKRVISKLKNLFEQYYEMLTSTVNIDIGQIKDLQGKRCILHMPNEFSFHLLQPSQVVMHLASDIDLVPFCHQLPNNLQKYDKLWKRLNIKPEIDPHICLEILTNIKAEVSTDPQASRSTLTESDPYWMVTMTAYNQLITLLLDEKWSEVNLSKCKIILPSDDYFLEENSKLVYNDKPQLRGVLKKEKSFSYKFIYPPKTDSAPPKALQVKCLSNVTSEELDEKRVFDKFNKCTDQELFNLKRRKHDCIMIEIISEKLNSDNFKDGLKRLYYNDHKKDPTIDQVFMEKLESLSSMCLLCKKNIFTVIMFKGKVIEGTGNKIICYLNMERNKSPQLLIAHPSFPDFYFWDHIAKIISNYLGISHGTPLTSILSCFTTDVKQILDNLGISPSYAKEIDRLKVDVGKEISLKEMNYQTTEDMLVFCDYKEGEKVLLNHIFKSEPKCVVAKVLKCQLKNGIKMEDKYVRLSVGDGNKTVNASLLQVYKFLNASQRENLSNKKSSRFCKPVVVAQLPKDQDELLEWIDETFQYNQNKKCCSFIQLAQRILSHLYFSLMKPSTEADEHSHALFLEAAENILKWAKHTDSNNVIKFVQGLRQLKVDKKDSPFVTTPTDKGVQHRQPSYHDYPPQPQYHLPHHGYPPQYSFYFPQQYILPLELSQQQKHRRSLEEPKTEIMKSQTGEHIRYKLVPIISTGHRVERSHPNQLAAKAWLQQAKADFLAASDLHSVSSDALDVFDTKYPALVCFLCHDAVEKSMKGMMYSKTGVPPNLITTKNLSTLMDKIKDSEANVDNDLLATIKSTVSLISVHGNKSRYPNYHYPPASPAVKYNALEADESLKVVKEMMMALSRDKDFSKLLGKMEAIEDEDLKMASKLILENEDIPEFWTPHDRTDGDFKLVLLDDQEHVEEVQFVESTFQATLPSTEYTIERIDRIQNKLIWRKYYDCAKRMMEFNKGEVNETVLFHGTRKTNPERIYKGDAGFDMRFSSEGFWGKGNYFAVNASFSDAKYAHRYDQSDYRQIIMAYVLVGYSTSIPQDRTLTKPPIMEDGDLSGITRRYDSVSGTTGGSKVYITYENDHAYPAYLITYRKNNESL